MTEQRGFALIEGNVKVGSACTISPDGDVFFTGVTTATTFTGEAIVVVVQI